jgi:hypothetical protein
MGQIGLRLKLFEMSCFTTITQTIDFAFFAISGLKKMCCVVSLFYLSLSSYY